MHSMPTVGSSFSYTLLLILPLKSLEFPWKKRLAYIKQGKQNTWEETKFNSLVLYNISCADIWPWDSVQDGSHCWDSISPITTLRISVIWSIHQGWNSDSIAIQHSVLPTAGSNGHSLLKFGEQNVWCEWFSLDLVTIVKIEKE